LCDGAAWLDHGRVLASGEVGDVVKAYVSNVNDLETQRGDDWSEDPEAMVGRSGSGEIRVARIELIDALGAAAPHAVYGDPVTIRMHYNASEVVDDALFGITVYHENGTFVTGTSTHLAALPTGRIQGRGYIDYELNRMNLTPGNYQVGIAVQDRHAQHHFDLVERYVGFAVRTRHGGTGTCGSGWDLEATGAKREPGFRRS
jgi:hypothetical protein